MDGHIDRRVPNKLQSLQPPLCPTAPFDSPESRPVSFCSRLMGECGTCSKWAQSEPRALSGAGFKAQWGEASGLLSLHSFAGGDNMRLIRNDLANPFDTVLQAVKFSWAIEQRARCPVCYGTTSLLSYAKSTAPGHTLTPSSGSGQVTWDQTLRKRLYCRGGVVLSLILQAEVTGRG